MKVTCCPLIWATFLEWRLQFVQFTCFHAFWHEIHQDWIDQWKYQKSGTLNLWWWFEALNLECAANSHPIFQPGGWLVSAERQEPQFFISILTDVEGEAARFIFLPNQNSQKPYFSFRQAALLSLLVIFWGSYQGVLGTEQGGWRRRGGGIVGCLLHSRL